MGEVMESGCGIHGQSVCGVDLCTELGYDLKSCCHNLEFIHPKSVQTFGPVSEFHVCCRDGF